MPAATVDQGPFEFRKILKPSTSRNTSRSDDSWLHGDADSTASDGGGPFDFRRLLRRTNNAPTDTLKRLRGVGTAFSASSASSTSV